MNTFVLESLVDDRPDIQQLLTSLLQRQERNRRSGDRGRSDVGPTGPSPSPTHDAPAADVLLIDLTPAHEGDASRCRVLRPRSELSALILKVVDGDNTGNADENAGEWSASPVGTGNLFAKALELADSHPESPQAIDEPPRGRTARFAGWTLDLALHILSPEDGPPVALPHTEFSLLLAFLDHPRQVLGRDELVACTRATTRNLSVRTVDVYVSRLRRRLASSRRNVTIIETRHRQGYVFKADPVFA